MISIVMAAVVIATVKAQSTIRFVDWPPTGCKRGINYTMTMMVIEDLSAVDTHVPSSLMLLQLLMPHG